jgi:adenosylcobinamide-GDP ribazoletransferase
MKREGQLFCVAVQFLTRLPAPRFEAFELAWLARSTRYFPLIGGLIGLASVAVYRCGLLVFPRQVAAGLMLAFSILLTGALHEDGWADTCDGLGGGRSREQSLAIMKDSRIGVYGALGLVLILGLKWSTLVALPVEWFGLAVVTAQAFSRWAALGLIWQLPYARDGLEGTALPFAGGIRAPGWLTAGLLGCVVPAGLVWAAQAAPSNLWKGLGIGVAVSAAVAFLTGAYVRHRLGGYTGDCLGAVQQLSELGFLLGVLAVSTVSA